MAENRREKWEIETIRQILVQSKITAQPDNQSKLFDPWDLNYNQAWEYSPAAAIDERFPFPLKIAGPEPFIGLQVSLGKWLHDCLGRRLGYLITFEDFWEQWSEKGFSWATKRQGVQNLKTARPVNDIRQSDGTIIPRWRKDKKQRPGYLEWESPEPKNNPYYRIIEYWPNRSIFDENYLLVGSDSQIIQHIVAIQYQGSGDSESEKKGVSEAKFLNGFPCLHIHFREKYTPPGAKKLISKFTLSLVGYVEEESLKSWDWDRVISDEWLKNMAAKIKRLFVLSEDTRWGFTRGNQVFSYHDWKKGIGVWSPLKKDDTNNAITLFKKLCAAINITFDEENMYSSVAKNRRSRTIKVLGDEHEVNKGHREGKVLFFKSFLILPASGKKITLVSFSSKDPVDIRLQDD